MDTMQLTEVERRILESRISASHLSLLDADNLQRRAPLARDNFDEILFRTTRFAFDEGDLEHFDSAIRVYTSLTASTPQHAPPLIPPNVYAAVTTAVANYIYPHRTAPRADQLPLTDHNRLVAERLLFTLGTDLGDGIRAAGQRTFSHMIAARIDDGVVHPAVGGWLWGGHLVTRTGAIAGGPHVEVMRTVGLLSEQWTNDPSERSQIEVAILAHASQHSWNHTDAAA